MMMGGMGGMRGGGGRFGHSGRDQLNEQDLGAIYDRRVVLRLMRYVRPYWRTVAVTFVAILAYTGTVVTLPWLVKWIIDSYIATRDISGLDFVAVLFVLVAAVQYLTNYVHLRLMARVSQRVLYTLRVEMFNHLQRLSMSYFDRNEVGKVMSRVQNDVQQLQEFLSIMIMSMADVLSLGGIVVVMFSMSPRLALITYSVVPVLFIVLIVWQRYARLAFLRVRHAIADVNAGLQENISGVRVVQSLNREQTNMRRFGEANHEHLDANMQAMKYSAALMPAVEVLTALGLALVVFFGGSMVLDGELQVGVLVAFALYIQRFFDPVRNLTMEYSQLQRSMASGARIFELLDTEPEVADKPDAIEMPPIRGEIVYEGVALEYEPGSPVLKDVDVHIKPGETAALVGPTGAGKTSMAALLLRLYDATEGSIAIDGHDVRDVKRESMVRQMSIVLQEPFLFSGTIKENIRHSHTEASDEDVVRAATAVGAHEFIANLEQGYDTPLQERGGNLSIGQRQLISLARALVADPHILILDEATANIDTYSEMLIQRALKQLLEGRTAVVVAHRLSTIRNADRILVLDQGRIVEQGKHDELMAVGGLYARLQAYTTDGDGAAAEKGEAPADLEGPRRRRGGPGRSGGRRGMGRRAIQDT